ncbi:Uncharacterised protein [Bordetella pertussis]|nr:Uncharacterised protein [Bordetella pertussis]
MRAIQPSETRLFSRNELITGERVRAITPDTPTAAASVKANSLNSEPVSPPIRPMGAYTAARVRVMAITGPATSRAPTRAACTGDLPSSIWRCTFSTTTMASSTTSPMASTIASSVNRLMEKPRDSMMAAAPSMDSGIVTTGTSTARSEPRPRKITATTMRTASSCVLRTSSIEALMKRASSNGTCTSTPGGRFCLMPGSRALMRSTMVRGLPTGVAFRPK